MALDLTLGLTLLALLFEGAFGYPHILLARIGHPVMWIGALIGWLDTALNREGAPPRRRQLAGLLALGVVLAATIGAGLVVQGLALLVPGGVVIAALAGSSLLAQRSLYEHVERVADGLEQGLPEGRRAVAQIVGRDPDVLDEAGVARAAIESLAENFSDGIVAPALWMAIGGLAGAAAYKGVNTADSMIGHRTTRHGDFGWAAARFDDLVNLPASRLSGALVVLGAAFVPGASPISAGRAMWRDAHAHRSPNAGWPEAAFAGALGLALAGPRQYGGRMSVDGVMGEGGRRDCTPADIRRALKLYRAADGVMIAGLGLASMALLVM